MANHLEPTKREKISAAVNATLMEGQSIIADAGAALVAAAKQPGRPTRKTPEIVEEIIMRLTTGESLLSIVLDERMPSPSAVSKWQSEDPSFKQAISDARAQGMHYLLDATYDIASGGFLSSGDARRDELKVKALNNIISKRNRAELGDTVRVEHASVTVHLDPTKFGDL